MLFLVRPEYTRLTKQVASLLAPVAVRHDGFEAITLSGSHFYRSDYRRVQSTRSGTGRCWVDIESSVYLLSCSAIFRPVGEEFRLATTTRSIPPVRRAKPPKSEKNRRGPARLLYLDRQIHARLLSPTLQKYPGKCSHTRHRQ
jgi:hypothetical protein